MTLNCARSYVSRRGDLESGKSSPRDFLEECIEAIEAREQDVLSFVHMDLKKARHLADESSKRWREGRTLSACDGMPVGVKDIIETEDFPTEMGSPLFVGWQSKRDAAVVKALRACGAVIVGKTDTTEFAAAHPNRTRNPWDIRRTPGGSSSGSAAAVAAGFLPCAIGTQVVGSILRPSSFCGTIGYKPSIGGINRGGSHDFHSQSCTGVIGASLADAWILARELAWRAGGDPGFPGIAGPASLPEPKLPRRIAALETPGWPIADEAARTAFQTGCSRLSDAGIEIVTRRDSQRVQDLEDALQHCNGLTRRINAFESRWPYNVYAGMDRTKMSRPAQERLEQGMSITADENRRDLIERDRIRQVYAGLADVVDCSIALSARGPAPIGRETGGDSNIFLVSGSNLGIPAWGLPVSEIGGLPLGMQVWGYINDDAMITSHAAALFEVLGRADLVMAGG